MPGWIRTEKPDNISMPAAASIQQYQEALNIFLQRHGDRESAAIRNYRRNCLNRFQELGFPSTHLEDWRFTDVTPLARNYFTPAIAVESPADLPEISNCLIPDCHHVVFVNGRYQPRLSSPTGRDGNFTLKSSIPIRTGRRQAATDSPATPQAPPENPFPLLNLAFQNEGVVLTIPAGVQVPKPIQILYLSRPESGPALFSPRNIITVGAGSRLTLVESYIGFGDQAYFNNGLTDLTVAESAYLEHVRVQAETIRANHIHTVIMRQESNSELESSLVTLGGKLIRNDTRVILAGTKCRCQLNGLYLARGRQHIDNHTLIEHRRPGCTSRELFKGILDGYGKGIFNGRIIVRPEAQQSDARQVNRNLLLSKTARVHTNPQLEIAADDVKCSHGSTTGHLDEEAFFYMRSRGLSREQAQALLMHGFVQEVIAGIRTGSVRRYIGTRVADWVPAGRILKRITS